MHKGRLEAFSDAAIAIFMTIMVLEMHPPHGVTWTALQPMLPTFLAYLLSFVYLGIYWNNHHHLMQAATGVTGAVLWANMHLLFWLSLIPFVTGWLGEHPTEHAPAAAYGGVLIMNAIAYTILYQLLVHHEGKDSRLAKAVGPDVKGWVSLVIYAVAIGLSFFWPLAAIALYVLVAIIWFVPDSRIERMFAGK